MGLSEKLIIKELSKSASHLRGALKGLSIGELIALIRKELKMSQRTLAARAKVPQSTVSHLERLKKQPNLATLKKILNALFCDLLIIPVLRDSVENLLLKAARQKAEKRVRYLLGSMNLEKQEPDRKLAQELIKKETHEILNSTKFWDEDEKV